MKEESQAAIPIQYSGYPLSIADLKKQQQKTNLALVKIANHQTASFQKNEITNDPNNWDLTWFNNYE